MVWNAFPYMSAVWLNILPGWNYLTPPLSPVQPVQTRLYCYLPSFCIPFSLAASRHKWVWHCVVKFTAEPHYNYSATSNQNVQWRSTIIGAYVCLPAYLAELRSADRSIFGTAGSFVVGPATQRRYMLSSRKSCHCLLIWGRSLTCLMGSW
jgi:hypothetical protein